MFAVLATVTAAVAIAGSVPTTTVDADHATPSTPSAGSHPSAAIHGVGGGRLDFVGYEGDPVSFRIHGRTTQPDGAPQSAEGTFHVTHVRADGSPFATFASHLDCLAVGGDVAVVTGVIDTFDVPGLPGTDLEGKRVGFTVSDDRPDDRIGWSWALGLETEVPRCMGTAPFFEIERGGFDVRG